MKGKAKGIFEATGFARDRQKLSGYFQRRSAPGDPEGAFGKAARSGGLSGMKKALSPSGEGALKGRRLAPRIRASPLPVPGMVEKAGISPLAARGKRRTRWTGALICKDLGARIRRRSLRPYQ